MLLFTKSPKWVKIKPRYTFHIFCQHKGVLFMILANKKRKKISVIEIILLMIIIIIACILLYHIRLSSSFIATNKKGNTSTMSDVKIQLWQRKHFSKTTGYTNIPYVLNSSNGKVSKSDSYINASEQLLKKLDSISPNNDSASITQLYGKFKFIGESDDGNVLAVTQSEAVDFKSIITLFYSDKQCEIPNTSAYSSAVYNNDKLFITTSDTVYKVDLSTMEYTKHERADTESRPLSCTALDSDIVINSYALTGKSLIAIDDTKNNISYSDTVEGFAVSVIPTGNDSFDVFSVKPNAQNLISQIDVTSYTISSDKSSFDKSEKGSITLPSNFKMQFNYAHSKFLNDDNGFTVFSPRDTQQNFIMFHVNKDDLSVDASQIIRLNMENFEGAALVE